MCSLETLHVLFRALTLKYWNNANNCLMEEKHDNDVLNAKRTWALQIVKRGKPFSLFYSTFQKFSYLSLSKWWSSLDCVLSYSKLLFHSSWIIHLWSTTACDMLGLQRVKQIRTLRNSNNGLMISEGAAQRRWLSSHKASLSFIHEAPWRRRDYYADSVFCLQRAVNNTDRELKVSWTLLLELQSIFNSVWVWLQRLD